MIDYAVLFIRIVVSLIFILGLIYLSFIYGGGKLQSMQNKRHIKVLERVPLSKDNALLVVKMGEKGFVVSSAQGKVEVINEVQAEDLQKLESDKLVIKQTNIMEALKNLRKKGE